MRPTQPTRREAGDAAASEEFARQTDPLRRELLAHCYRMLGSVHDAEDLVQETMLRAGGPTPISIRTGLDADVAAPDRHQRLPERPGQPQPAPLPSDLTGPGSLADAPHRPSGRHAEVTWLQPFPDALLAPGDPDPGGAADPAAIVAARDSVRLAFVAALQHLPARQRAVLILRDVLPWRAAEVADLLEITTAAGEQRAAARPGPAARHQGRRPAASTASPVPPTANSGRWPTATSRRSCAPTSRP